MKYEKKTRLSLTGKILKLFLNSELRFIAIKTSGITLLRR